MFPRPFPISPMLGDVVVTQLDIGRTCYTSHVTEHVTQNNMSALIILWIEGSSLVLRFLWQVILFVTTYVPQVPLLNPPNASPAQNLNGLQIERSVTNCAWDIKDEEEEGDCSCSWLMGGKERQGDDWEGGHLGHHYHYCWWWWGSSPPPPPAISGNPIEREEKAPSGGAAGLAVLLSTSAVGKADPDQPS